MDVLVQHHPEYVSLAWGAMKILLVSAQNHEATISLISKALSQIAERLPRIELITILYPTERIRRAVACLYANIIRFFIRAYQWCQASPLKHFITSITQPPELRYKDILDDIATNSLEIDQLAHSSACVERRENSLNINAILAKIVKMESFQISQSNSLTKTY
ncbi:Nacht domain protein [Fusarium austroafricanum]|uniref:Nacht domain protein n=1 Tax=Fusarium austroafricanum TaxID=2364996 RepID=A0A8H4JD80_9HYPO|nr:Nacht domain protein [Fusarium austroafricanum]